MFSRDLHIIWVLGFIAGGLIYKEPAYASHVITAIVSGLVGYMGKTYMERKQNGEINAN